MTCLLVAALGAIFLRGFNEAIWLAVVLVAVFLVVNVVVIGYELLALVDASRGLIALATRTCSRTESRPWMIVRPRSVSTFPKLALGLSGFETGVAVMPLVHGDGRPMPPRACSRGSPTHASMLTAAALIMSVLLIGSSIVTATRIPPDALEKGGPPTAAPWPTWPIETSAIGSARSTTCPLLPHSGSLVRRPWLAC